MNIGEYLAEQEKLESQYFQLSGDVSDSKHADSIHTKTKRIKQRANGNCEVCGKITTRLYVHHEIYPKKLGYEKDNDLIALCCSCHRKAHTKQAWIYEQ